MMSGLSLVADKLCPLVKNAENNKKLNILVLGTGTGILPIFIRQHFSALLEKLTTVEIDAGVLIAAKNHFGFNADEDPQIESVNADAYEFIWNQPAGAYDMVFFDVNYEEDDVKVSPPMKFFQPDFIAKLVEITAAEGGLIAFNTIIDDAANRRKVV